MPGPGSLLRAGAGRGGAGRRGRRGAARRGRDPAAVGVRPHRRARRPDPASRSRSVDRPEHRALAREAAIGGHGAVEERRRAAARRRRPPALAVIGPNADRAQIMGGGSAALRAHYRVTPLEALRDAPRRRRRRSCYERGCDIDKAVPPLQGEAVVGADGDARLRRSSSSPVRDRAGEPVGPSPLPGQPAAVRRRAASGRASRACTRGGRAATFTPGGAGAHTVHAGPVRPGPAAASTATLVLDGVNDPPPAGSRYFGRGERRARGRRRAGGRPAGRARHRVLERRLDLPARGAGRLPPAPRRRPAWTAPSPPRRRPTSAVVVVGTNDDWETEGEDRDDAGPAGRPGRARAPGDRGQPAHGRGAQHRARR